MRQKVHTRRVLIVIAASLIAILVPVTVLSSLDASADNTTGNAELASMVIFGTLLIGLGAVLRRTA
jgi:predicted transporter